MNSIKGKNEKWLRTARTRRPIYPQFWPFGRKVDFFNTNACFDQLSHDRRNVTGKPPRHWAAFVRCYPPPQFRRGALPRLHEEIGFSVILPLATITIVIISIVIVLNRPQEVAKGKFSHLSAQLNPHFGCVPEVKSDVNARVGVFLRRLGKARE